MQKTKLLIMVLGLIAISFIFFGYTVLSFYDSDISKGKESVNWYETTGVITSSYLATDTDYDSDYGDSTTYTPKIEYKYSVNGINYSGNKVSFEIVSGTDYSWAQSKVDSYYEGKVVSVYYNPNNPSESVLEKGFSEVPFFLTLMGYVFITVGLVCLVIMLILMIKDRSSGKMNIQIERTYFKPGEEIQGNVLLNFRKQKHAKALKITLIGERVVIQRDRNGTRQTNIAFYKNEAILDTEKDYLNETYPFRIMVPKDILQKAKEFREMEQDVLKDEQGQLNYRKSSLREKSSKVINWGERMGLVHFDKYNKYYIEAVLEVSKDFDVKSTRDLTIYE